jgi:hypothetical protein
MITWAWPSPLFPDLISRSLMPSSQLPSSELAVRSRTQVLLITVTAAMVVLLLFLAWNFYPVSNSDAAWFVPGAQWQSRQGLLYNKLIDFVYDSDPSGEGRFLFYPPFFTFLIGKLASFSSDTSYRPVFLWIAVARLTGVIIFAFLVWKLLVVNMHLRRYWLLLTAGLMTIASQALYLLPANGRGEILTMTLVSAAMAMECTRWAHRRWGTSALIALIFSISIANGALALWIYALYLIFIERSLGARLRWIVATSILMSFWFLLSYKLTGVDITAGLAGVRANASMQLNRTDTSIPYLFSWWKSWVLFALLAVVQTLVQLRRSNIAKMLHGADRIYLAATVAVLAGCIYLFALRTAPSHYSLYAFLPLFQILSLGLLAENLARSASSRGYTIFLVICLATLMSLLSPLQALAFYPYYSSSGRTYQEAKLKADELKASTGCSLLYTNGLYALDPELQGSIFSLDSSGVATSRRIQKEESESGKRSCRLILVQELNSVDLPPKNAKMILDFSDQSPQLAFLRKIRALNSPKGYSFKAYLQEISK